MSRAMESFPLAGGLPQCGPQISAGGGAAGGGDAVGGGGGGVLSRVAGRRLRGGECDSGRRPSSARGGGVGGVWRGRDFAPFLPRHTSWAPRAENRIHRCMEKKPRSARLRIPSVNE